LTLRDVLEDSVTELVFAPGDPDLARGGGLRRGSYRIGGRGTLVLSGLAFVPHVRLTGRIRHFGERRQRGTLRVAGATGGRLVLRGNRADGVLGGKRVRAHLTALARSPTAAAAAARPSAAGLR
jgi:hypothetical protein